MQVLSAAKQQKRDLVAKMSKSYGDGSSFVFLFRYDGLKADKTYQLRTELRNVGATMVVLRNTLNARALKDAGFEGLSGLLKGQIAAVFGTDCVGIAKIVSSASDEKSIDFVAYSDGKGVYGVDALSALAKLPSLEVLRAKLLGLLLSVPTKFVSLLLECPRSLVRVLDSKAKIK